ncbi:MAG: hypothetical protein HOI42_14545 [Candidatus Marinimicrobia bacterium]|nr:hypothetical protein [Candidatus Neomarinimicrobiota bacterium]
MKKGTKSSSNKMDNLSQPGRHQKTCSHHCSQLAAGSHMPVYSRKLDERMGSKEWGQV